MTKTKAIKIAQSVLMIVIGILIACSIIQQNIINILLGVALLIYGAFIFFNSVYLTKSFIFASGIVGAVLIGIGIGVLCNAVPLTGFIVEAIKISILTIGALFILDSIVKFILRFRNTAIVELIIGLILVALGILLYFFSEYLWLLFGICLALLGVYSLICVFIKIDKYATRKAKSK